MPRYIIHHEGVYNEYTTVADGPCWESGMTLEQFKEYYQLEYGRSSMDSLEQRLKRANETGTSAMMEFSLEETVHVFLEHESMDLNEFIERYLTL